jgi:hypothetical protein
LEQLYRDKSTTTFLDFLINFSYKQKKKRKKWKKEKNGGVEANAYILAHALTNTNSTR